MNHMSHMNTRFNFFFYNIDDKLSLKQYTSLIQNEGLFKSYGIYRQNLHLIGSSLCWDQSVNYFNFFAKHCLKTVFLFISFFKKNHIIQTDY